MPHNINKLRDKTMTNQIKNFIEEKIEHLSMAITHSEQGKWYILKLYS